MKTLRYNNGQFDFTTHYRGHGVAIVHNDTLGINVTQVNVDRDLMTLTGVGCSSAAGSVTGLEKSIAFTRECYREETKMFNGHINVTFSFDEVDGSVQIDTEGCDCLGWVHKDDPEDVPPGLGSDIIAAARKWAGWAP